MKTDRNILSDMTSINGSKVFIDNGEVKTILNEEIQRTGYMSVEDGRRITLEAIAKTFKDNEKY